MFSQEAYLVQLADFMNDVSILKRLSMVIISVYLSSLMFRKFRSIDKFLIPGLLCLGWIWVFLFYLKFFKDIAYYFFAMASLCVYQFSWIIKMIRDSWIDLVPRSKVLGVFIIAIGVIPIERLLLGGDWWTFNDKNFQVFLFDVSSVQVSLITLILLLPSKKANFFDKLSYSWSPTLIIAHFLIVAIVGH